MSNDLSDKDNFLGTLADRVGGLSPAKRRLLELRLKEQRADERHLSTIPRLADRSAVPLSFAQQRLWFFDQMEPGSTVYNNPAVFRLRGSLNVAALEKALNELLRRHEVLRTSFVLLESEPVQVVADQATLTLPVLDLRHMPESEREAEARRLAAEEIRRPFDLSKAPLFRAALLILDTEDHFLAMTVHHIASDGWSSRIIGREISTLYEAFRTGKTSPLPELPVQYADFAAWQRQWLHGEVLQKQLSYWKKQLEGLPTLDFPTDSPRPAVQTFRGEKVSLVLPGSLSGALEGLSRQEGITPFMAFLAAFTILLHRHTGQDDIVVGAPIAGRNHAEIEDLIGFFVNTLVLRTDLSGDPTFRELLARVRSMALGAYAHQDLPFEKIVEELHPERDLSRTPLFQVFFNMLDLVAQDFRLPALSIERLALSQPESKFDFTVYIRRGGSQETRFEMVYNTALFRQDRMNWMLRQFQTLLEGIAADPDQPLSRLRLLTESEWKTLSRRRNVVCPAHAFVPIKREETEQSIPARFQEQARKFSDHAAIRTRTHQWTYSELNHRANRIATALLGSCGDQAQNVALLLGQDAPMIAGILGVLKIGKTYVPLDASFPVERLAYLLEDSQAEVLLTDGGNLASAKALTNGSVRLINIDDIDLTVAAEDPALPVSPDALAYILYTSGSTGRPKGVMQSHRNVLCHIRNYTNNLQIAADDRMTLLASYSFDAAVMDIFGALLNGATLVPLDPKVEGPSSLLSRMKGERVTIYHSTPTLYRYLFDSSTDKTDLSTIRLVVLGGEEVYKKDLDLFKRRLTSQAIFINGLGPTESTLALQYFMNHETETAGNVVPVGYPVEDTEILLLDKAGEETELYGEIAVRSPHCALGYWQRPELTEAAFLADPHDQGRRIYRTGDMGYLMPDGTIAFAGRRDLQVKIRGFRIELGEVETALSQHPAVRETVVDVQEDPSTSLGVEKHLVAYVVSNPDLSPSTGELRTFLKEKLPDYMVPSAFVLLDKMPLTPNGKVDRKALPEPDDLFVRARDEYVAPSTALEKLIAEVWQEVLGVDRVGVHDNFFDLGGHSLLSVKVIGRIEEKTGRRIHPRDMVYQTLEQLAVAYERCERTIQTDAPQRLSSRLLGALKGMLNQS